jgi:DNA replication protein DnaC
MSELNRKIGPLLKELRLSSIKEAFKERTEQAEKDEVGYGEYLLELLELEATERYHKRVGRFLRESKLPLEKSLATFDLQRLPFKTRRVVEVLLEGDFLKRKENILAFGKPGSGKTHVLCAIAQELIHRGKRICFTSCRRLVEELLKAKKELEVERALKKMDKFDAVLIDDIGYVQYTREEMEVLFTFLAHRYERGSLMITSNLPFSKWEQIFKDPMTTAAAIDRIVHHSVILELNLESYRMEVARKQMKED